MSNPQDSHESRRYRDQKLPGISKNQPDSHDSVDRLDSSDSFLVFGSHIVYRCLYDGIADVRPTSDHQFQLLIVPFHADCRSADARSCRQFLPVLMSNKLLQRVNGRGQSMSPEKGRCLCGQGLCARLLHQYALDDLVSMADREDEISSQPPATEGKPRSPSDVP